MTTSNNIILNVGNQGLSFAIDKELDKQLGKDVTLNYNQWTSVFNIIKANQVETNKSQFGENDTNISDGKQFVVQQNEQYQIKSNVWSQIVDIAKQSLGLDSQPIVEPAVNETKSETEQQSNEEKVKTLLQNSSINFESLPEEFKNDIISKYGAMSKVAEGYGQTLDDKTAQTRLMNYIKGKQYVDFQQSLTQENLETSFNEHCKDGFKNTEELKDAYKAFGDAFVEYYDRDGLKDSKNKDMNINFQEMLFTELINRYTMTGDTKAVAEQKALKAMEKFKDLDMSQIDNWQLDDSEESLLATEVALTIATLDQDKDYKISTNEAGAYLLTTAQALDDKNAITGNEILAVQSAIINDDEQSNQNLSEKLKTYYDFLTK